MWKKLKHYFTIHFCLKKRFKLNVNFYWLNYALAKQMKKYIYMTHMLTSLDDEIIFFNNGYLTKILKL